MSEVKAPDGYLILTEPIRFKILRDYSMRSGFKIVTETGGDWPSDSMLQPIIDDNPIYDGTFLLKLKNNAGAALPNTGGPGTRVFTVLGSILVLLGGALLVRKYRFLHHTVAPFFRFGGYCYVMVPESSRAV